MSHTEKRFQIVGMHPAPVARLRCGASCALKNV